MYSIYNEHYAIPCIILYYPGTRGLITRVSNINRNIGTGCYPGLRGPGPTTSWYFKQKQITPRNYLLYEREIYRDGVWATDVEIMAASAILDTDIYVANNIYTSTDEQILETRWSLIRSKVNDD